MLGMTLHIDPKALGDPPTRSFNLALVLCLLAVLGIVLGAVAVPAARRRSRRRS
jgi:hypothetical protein